MKAMILAAGRGSRLHPITTSCPKPLVPVAGKPLIVRHLEALKRLGLDEVVINVSYRAQQLMDALGNGHQFGLSIHYSIEQPTAYGTAGGIRHALPWLTDPELLVVNADVLTDFNVGSLSLPADCQAHIVLVDNPADNPDGDFALVDNKPRRNGDNKLTFAGIGLYQRQLFQHLADQTYYPLSRVLFDAMQHDAVMGSYFQGQWHGINDVAGLQLAEREWQEPVYI